jgi:hypothetical protein
MLAGRLLCLSLGVAPATARPGFARGDGVTSCSARPGVCDIAPAQGPPNGSLTVTVPATGEVYLRSVYCRGAKEMTETCTASREHTADKSKAWTGDPPKKVQAHAGICATEIPHGAGDCQQGESGTWVSRVYGITSVAKCAGMCERHCPRCQYVSFSQAKGACSWFAGCSLPLQQKPAGYVTMAVVRGRIDKFHSPYPDAPRPKRSSELAFQDANQLRALRDNPLAQPQDAAVHAQIHVASPDAAQLQALRENPLLYDPLAQPQNAAGPVHPRSPP